MSEPFISVEIVFENLDYIRIPFEYIGALDISDTTDNSSCYCRNAETKHLVANAAHLQILKSFLTVADNLGEGADLYEKFESRIFRNDITFFRIHYSNDTYTDIYIPWEDAEGNEFQNCLQKTYLDSDGNINIDIKKDSVL